MKQHLCVVIATLNSQYIHSSLAPWCLLAGIREYCEGKISASVVEGTINEKLSDVAERIIEKRPQVIGFSCYIWNITATRELIQLIKSQLPNAIIVFGGPEVSYNADTVLKDNLSVDYVISGEGEKPFALLLNAILNDEDKQSLPGVCYRQDGQAVVADPYISEEEPPTPYTMDYFNALNGRISYLETSRGCPYSCAFCLSGRCGNARFFNIERAKKELLLLANSGTQTIKLIDRTFNANSKRAFELFDFIIKNYGNGIPKNVCFHFEIAGDILDDATINLIATAPIGFIQLEIGLQSFNPKTLELINRKTNIANLKSNINRIIKNQNMHIHIDLIAGLPYEDLKSFTESINTAFELKPHMLQLGFLKMLHGSPMRDKPEVFPCEYSQFPPYEVTKTPWLSVEELKVLHQVEDALDRIYNSGRFRRTLEYLIVQCGYTPFELFKQFGAFTGFAPKLSLDDYTTLIFEYFIKQPSVDSIILRDKMVCDRLSTISTGLLPQVLQVKDPSLSKIKAELNNNILTRQPKGVKRGLALLYSEHCVVYVDYQNKNPITGEYHLERYYNAYIN